MVWELAQEYYNDDTLFEKLNINCPQENIRPKAIELVAQVESLDLDYIFEYASVAMQHRLQYIRLPKEINLGHFEYQDTYKRAEIKVRGPGGESIVKGSAIQYALTILDEAPHRGEAIEFLQFLLTDEAKNILERNGHTVYFLFKGDTPLDAQFLKELE